MPTQIVRSFWKFYRVNFYATNTSFLHQAKFPGNFLGLDFISIPPPTYIGPVNRSWVFEKLIERSSWFGKVNWWKQLPESVAGC